MAKKEEKKKKGGRARSLIQGRWLSLEAYQRNLAGVVVVVSLFVIYITFKYSVQMKLSEIITLRRELANARTDMVRASAAYSNRVRESELTQALDSLHLNLRVAEQPPYYLDKTGNQDGEEKE